MMRFEAFIERLLQRALTKKVGGQSNFGGEQVDDYRLPFVI